MKTLRFLLAALLLSAAGFAQNGPPGGQSLSLQFQQAGTPIVTRAGGFLPINCSTGMTCTYTAGVVVLTSSGGGGGTAFPVTVTGGVSGAVPCFTATTTEAAGTLLAANALVLGGGTGVCPSTNTQLTFSAPTLTIGLAGTSSGILSLTGSTSGNSTFTAPAVAGTTTNDVVMTNGLSGPDGTVALPSYSFTSNTGSGMSYNNGFSSLVLGVNGNGALATNGSLVWLAASTPLGFRSSTIFAGAVDTAISRLGAASFAFGNGTQGDFSGTIKATIDNEATGYQIAGAATSGNYLRGNGTNFVSSAIQAGDIPTAIPIANIGSAGLSGTAPIAIASTGAISITGAAGQVLAGASPAFTATPALGTDASVAGTLTLSNGSANAHSIFSSGATTTNTIAGFTVVPVTGDVVTCTSASTTCTLTDGGVLLTALAPLVSPSFTTPSLGVATATSIVASTSLGTGTPPTCTAGTGGVWCAGEGTAPTAASGVDQIYGDSTNHVLEASQNNFANAASVSFFPVAVNSINTQTVSYSMVAQDNVILCNKATAMQITLIVSAIPSGKQVRVKNIGAGACTVAPTSGNIDNQTTVVLPQYSSLDAVWDGTQWWIL